MSEETISVKKGQFFNYHIGSDQYKMKITEVINSVKFKAVDGDNREGVPYVTTFTKRKNGGWRPKGDHCGYAEFTEKPETILDPCF